MDHPDGTDTRADFAEAARAFGDLVTRIPPGRWDGPGLGDWDLRALVGHTTRSLTTVLTYLPQVTAELRADSAADYYRLAADMMNADPAAVTERGRQAGLTMGDDPVSFVGELIERCLAAVDATDSDPVIESIVGGIRLREYLITRVFELVVHSLDIAAATGLEYRPPEAALTRCLRVTVDVAVRRGDGATLLLALTGRRALPERFSVV